jgi:hypothetical protein
MGIFRMVYRLLKINPKINALNFELIRLPFYEAQENSQGLKIKK